jgi:hypothetical protein
MQKWKRPQSLMAVTEPELRGGLTWDLKGLPALQIRVAFRHRTDDTATP